PHRQPAAPAHRRGAPSRPGPPGAVRGVPRSRERESAGRERRAGRLADRRQQRSSPCDDARRGRRDGRLQHPGPLVTRDEIEAALHKLGWRVIAGPTQTAGGYAATIQCGTVSMAATGATELSSGEPPEGTP